jgi:3'(2'), 5'-bisphosphate nucleotidase
MPITNTKPELGSTTTTPWARERQAAIDAVRIAAQVCRSVQQRLVTPETLQKKDRSPVTVADFASQAVVCAHLAAQFPQDRIIAEENAAELRQDANAAVRKVVVEQVAAAIGKPIAEAQALDWIDRGGHDAKGSPGSNHSPQRFWTLDPIDGTKGFLRGEQYAVALALIENGQVVLGALACPNLPFSGSRSTGVLLVAARGQGTQALPLWQDAPGQPARVAAASDTAQARFCESVESEHSDQTASKQIAQLLRITAEPLRMDSQAKYATVARGDASIYLRLPTRADYREKIWDHAAGMIAVEEAGGRVTDVGGKPLDFSRGSTLANNRGIIATNGSIHDAVLHAVRQVLR